MNQFELTYKPYGEQSILIEWPEKVDENILKDVTNFKNRLEHSVIKSLIEINSSYNSLLITYDYTINNFYDAFSQLRELYFLKDSQKKTKNKLWKIPVCYDSIFASDIINFSKEKKLSSDEIIELHSSTIYTVYFIGFLPGFLYLGGLDKTLHFSRKSTPNLHVKKGSVAIGGEQTGIYPQDSPGGWHIIGNSPINFFDVNKSKPCFASAGDKLQFVPVDLVAYQNIKARVDIDDYKMESEVLSD